MTETFRESDAKHDNLAVYLERERTRLFVGREREIHRFERFLEGESETHIVMVSGPAGIGKTLLVERLLVLAKEHSRPASTLDAAQLPEAAPAFLESAIAERIAAFDDRAPVNLLAIDNSERLAPMETWLRQRLPVLVPANTLLLLAGRWQPPTGWLADPALASVLEHWPLPPLNPNEVENYARERGLGARQQDAAAGFARGHPLALALAADHLHRSGAQSLEARSSGDLIQRLIEWLLSDVKNTRYRDCLEVAASVRCINEPILHAMLPEARADELYQWLAHQPFMEHRPAGLAMHELVRTVIVEDLRRRNLPEHHRLIRRASDYYMARVEQLGPEYLQQTVADWAFTVRWEPYMRRYYDMAFHAYYLDRPRQDELGLMADLVAHWEGNEARRWFREWCDRGPDVLEVVRDDAGRVRGLLLCLLFGADDPWHQYDDPAVGRYLSFFRDHCPLEGEDNVLMVRFILDAEHYQQTTPVFSQLEMKVNGLAFMPGLAYFAVVCDRDKDWQSSADYANFRPLPGTEFETSRQRLSLRGVNLRAEPPLIWIRNIVERMLGSPAGDSDPAPAAALTRDEFGKSVLSALHRFHDDQALLENPLLRSHLPENTDAQSATTPEQLRKVIRKAVVQIDKEAPHKHLGEILERRYLGSRDKEIIVAADLNISESTFRRRLRDAERRLIDKLWWRETRRGSV